MNEYTRREEVRWTLVAAAALVVCIGAAIVLLMTARGKVIPDEAARASAKAATDRAAAAQVCVVAAEKLVAEIEVFRGAAKAARLSAEDPDAGPRRRRPKEKAPDVELAWASAQPSYKQAKALAPCRAQIEPGVAGGAFATAAWDAIGAASAVAPPAEGDKAAQVDTTRKLLGLLGEAPIDKALANTRDAAASLKAAAEAAAKHAETATVIEPLRQGLMPRELAILIGVGLCLAALLVSYLSVRVASGKRYAVLMPLRKAGQPGAQAAAVLSLAAQPNGGEPGLVVGAALGGLLSAALRPTDADMFALGVMTGLLLGLGLQVGLRATTGASRFRARATELGDIEKPQIPIVLVLSGVNQGLEANFLKFFRSLGPADAAATVEKLAYQAEEKILAAAEAGAARAQPAGGYPPPPGYPRP